MFYSRLQISVYMFLSHIKREGVTEVSFIFVFAFAKCTKPVNCNVLKLGLLISLARASAKNSLISLMFQN